MASIHIAKLERVEDGFLIFAAQDGATPFELRVPAGRWEELRADCPVPCTSEDQRDFALGEIERLAEAGEFGATPADRSS